MNHSYKISIIGVFLFLGIANAQHPVRFEAKILTTDLNEGCDIADFDGDGKLDIVAGRNWYRNGEMIPRPIRLIEDRSGYVRSNGEWVYDVNNDGRPDIVSMDFVQGEVCWFENPGGEELMRGDLWQRHVLADTGYMNNETSYLVDIVGDKNPEWISDQWKKENPMIIWSFGSEQREFEIVEGRKTRKEWRMAPMLTGHKIGDINGHGIGFGDINNDGRRDIIFAQGWYEKPEGDPLSQTWALHKNWDIKGSCPMLIYDVDGDGANDLVWGNAHDYGLYYWKSLGPDNTGELQFEEHVIDESFSQPHCLHLADLDGDGKDELITGKRFRAHNGKDPGADEPLTMRYYVWDDNTKKFHGYLIGEFGIGLQIRTADIDSDGDIDIVVAGKDGTQILSNMRISR